MKKTIFNSKNLLLNAILLSFLFLFTTLLGGTFFSYTVDASTSDDETFDNIFGNLNSNDFKNYRLPGQKDSAFPSENLESLDNKPLPFGSNNDYGYRNFCVPNEEDPNLRDYEEYCKAVKSISSNTPTKNLKNFFLFDPDCELPFSSSIDFPIDEYTNQLPFLVYTLFKEDIENGTYDKTGGPLYKKLNNAHYLNLVSLNPNILYPHLKDSSTSNEDLLIKRRLGDYKNTTCLKLKKQLLDNYLKNRPQPTNESVEEEEEEEDLEELGNRLYQEKINEIESESLEFLENQAEGANDYALYVIANDLADEQFLFNKINAEIKKEDERLLSLHESQENAWDEFNSYYE